MKSIPFKPIKWIYADYLYISQDDKSDFSFIASLLLQCLTALRSSNNGIVLFTNDLQGKIVQKAIERLFKTYNIQFDNHFDYFEPLHPANFVLKTRLDYFFECLQSLMRDCRYFIMVKQMSAKRDQLINEIFKRNYGYNISYNEEYVYNCLLNSTFGHYVICRYLDYNPGAELEPSAVESLKRINKSLKDYPKINLKNVLVSQFEQLNIPEPEGFINEYAEAMKESLLESSLLESFYTYIKSKTDIEKERPLKLQYVLSGHLREIEYTSKDTVADLKQKILNFNEDVVDDKDDQVKNKGKVEDDEVPVAAINLCLVYKGQELKDEDRVIDYNIFKDSIIICEKIMLQVNVPGSDTLQIEIASKASVKNLEDEIRKALNIPFLSSNDSKGYHNHVVIAFNKKTLSDSTLDISKCGITNDCILNYKIIKEPLTIAYQGRYAMSDKYHAAQASVMRRRAVAGFFSNFLNSYALPLTIFIALASAYIYFNYFKGSKIEGVDKVVKGFIETSIDQSPSL